jgi:hypothetical protein
MSEEIHNFDDYGALLATVYRRVQEEQVFAQALLQTLDGADGARAHLAVMHEPYLSYILHGRKTIESRFSRRQVAPYGQVRAGDVVLLKALGGAVSGLAIVGDVDYYVLDPQLWGVLRERFAAALAAEDDDFWEQRRDARFATLMRVRQARAIEPVWVGKRDRRGWVVLDPRSSLIHPDQLELGEPQDRAQLGPLWVVAPELQISDPPPDTQLRWAI